METSRRTFIKHGSLALAGAVVLSRTAQATSSAPANEVLSLQLYSVRDDMKRDPLGTLTALAKMGYKNVEHANYIDRKLYGYSVSEFKKVLADLGLKMPSGHTVMGTQHWDSAKKEFTDAWKYTVEDAAALGQKFVVSPWLDESLRRTYDDMLRYMEVFNKSGELCNKYGMKFGYHNHDFEFSQKLNGIKVFDIIMQNTDPKLVSQQLDIGNMYNGGGRAIEILKQYPGRFEMIHVKDEIEVPGKPGTYESCILGQGIIKPKEVIDLSRKIAGSTYFVIEQESYQNKLPMECMKENFDMMKKWGY